jgi:DNA replication protein DnaC
LIINSINTRPRLIEELRIAHGDGSYIKFLKMIAKASLIVLDDWGLTAFSTQDRADLLEILDDRVNAGSTLIASQLPVDTWLLPPTSASQPSPMPSWIASSIRAITVSEKW